MPGKLDRNLRQGHNAQGDGVQLLRRICAVASVNQEDDTGFDAVATLLREDGRSLYAEESFWVQFKSRSVRRIDYVGHECRWLRRLSIPLFIASVDSQQQQLELYTTHAVSCLPYFPYQSASLYLDPPERSEGNRHLHRYLGEPIARWTAQDGNTTGFRDHVYRVMKHWVEQEYLHVGLRAVGEYHEISWETNHVPAVKHWLNVGGEPDGRKSRMEAAVPQVRALGLDAITAILRGESGNVNDAVAFALLSDWFTRNGVDGLEAVQKLAGHCIANALRSGEVTGQ